MVDRVRSHRPKSRPRRTTYHASRLDTIVLMTCSRFPHVIFKCLVRIDPINDVLTACVAPLPVVLLTSFGEHLPMNDQSTLAERVYPSSRVEAIERGDIYYKGRDCTKGHGAIRYAMTTRCVACASIRTKAWYARNKTNPKYIARSRRKELERGPRMECT